jgi:hypothetical protein
MDPSQIYALVTGGILIIFLTFRLILYCYSLLNQSSVQYWIFRYLIYPRLHVIWSLPYYEIIIQAGYWAGTITSNVIGVQTLQEASIRAARLSILNLTPLFASNHLGFIAYIMGIPLQTITHLHSSVAVVAIAESVFHITTIRLFNFENPIHIYGLVVCLFLLENVTD